MGLYQIFILKTTVLVRFVFPLLLCQLCELISLYSQFGDTAPFIISQSFSSLLHRLD